MSKKLLFLLLIACCSNFWIGCDASFPEERPLPIAVVFGPQENRLVTADSTGFIRYFDIAATRDNTVIYTEKKLFLPPMSNLRSLVFSLDGKKLLVISGAANDSRSADGLWIWDLADKSKKPQTIYREYKNRESITNAALSPDGSKVALGIAPAGDIEIYDLSSGQKILTLHHIYSNANKVYFLPSSSPSLYRLLVVEQTGRLILWTLQAPLSVYSELWADNRGFCQEISTPDVSKDYELKDVEQSSDGNLLYYSWALGSQADGIKPAYRLALLDTRELPYVNRLWHYSGPPSFPEEKEFSGMPLCAGSKSGTEAILICSRRIAGQETQTFLIEKPLGVELGNSQASHRVFREGSVGLQAVSPRGSFIVLGSPSGDLEIYPKDDLSKKVLLQYN